MRPTREEFETAGRTYFVSSQTAQRKALFRTERWALLLEEVLLHYRSTSYRLHAYVLMPDHVHLLLSPLEPLERSLQKIKGGFSFRAKRELLWNGEIWQPGFSDHRIRDGQDWERHVSYLEQNPVRKQLCMRAADYRWLKTDLDPVPQGLKPLNMADPDGGAEAPPLHNGGPVGLDIGGSAKVVPSQSRITSAEAPPLHHYGISTNPAVKKGPVAATTLSDDLSAGKRK